MTTDLSPADTAAIARLRNEDTTSFYVGGEFVGWVEPVWDPSTFPCRVAAWLAFDERPQADGAPRAGLGSFRRRAVAEAIVERRISDCIVAR